MEVPNYGHLLTEQISSEAALFLLAVILVVALIAVSTLGTWWSPKDKTIQDKGTKRMVSKRYREKELKVLIADVVTEGLEDAEFQGKISREEKTFWYKRLGNVLSIKDLLPENTRLLKEEIKGRLATNYKTSAKLPDQDKKPTKRRLREALNA